MYYMPFSQPEEQGSSNQAANSRPQSLQLQLPQNSNAPTSSSPANSFKIRNDTTLTRRRDTYPFIDPYRFRNSLRGQIVLITNASRGIGRATALDFASAGATLVLTARDAVKLQALLSEIRERYQTPAYSLAADFRDANAPVQLIQNITQNLGQIDVLINVTHGPPVTSFEHEADFLGKWWGAMELELRAPLALIHAVLPHMTARGKGTIITTTKPTAFLEVPFTSTDSSCNAALIRFHQALDYEIRPKGVQCYAVSPGMVASHLHDPDAPNPITEQIGKDPRIESDFGAIIAEYLGKNDNWSAAGLASGTFLALAADPRTDCLSGLYIDAERDLGEVVADAEKKGQSRIEMGRLYRLQLHEL